MIRFLLIIAVYLASVKANATPIKLTLAINSPGTPPHLYFDAAQKHYVGVIPDILTTAENDNAIEVTYVDSHRSRSETFVAEGQLDMFYSSLEWLDEPERFIATDPIFLHKSYLYSNKPLPTGFGANAHTHARICTRRGFHYPGLQPWFDEGNLVRIDSSNHETMLKMVLLGRCDAAELNVKNMRALQQQDMFKGIPFHRSETPTSIVAARLIMHPSQVEARNVLNNYIREFLAQDLYEESLKRHINNTRYSPK
ncbi:hypothetical protein KUL152_12020 [Tenacibaculum sp. KUL152]|nr:hypothetical protein KUL152_12020 [Tenacibaculum sp. KUL152]